MKISSLFEEIDDSLTGYIDIQGLARLLPDIDNPPLFDEAVGKLRLGNGAHLTIPEKIQLANAFIGLLGLDPVQKSQIFRRLSSIKAKSEQPSQNVAQPVA